MNLSQQIAQFRADRSKLERYGVSWMAGAEPLGYMPEEFKYNYGAFEMAMDAQPALLTTASAGVPALFTTLVDPTVFEVLFAPNRATEILGEVKRGSWVDDVILFPVVEATGEVSSYGDYNNNGRAGVNANWPQRQAYRYQLIKEYGELEMDRAGAAKINLVSEIDKAAATTINKFHNFGYFFGVQGLQNFGLLNDPNLGASLTPSTKAAGGTAWITAGGVVNATANEVYADIQAIYYQLVTQTQGLVTAETPIVLALAPNVEVALHTTNSFGLNVYDMLKKNFPNIKVVTAPQYGVITTGNPQGVAAGNLVQMIATEVEGQQTGFMAYSEKMRAHPVIRHMSSFRQKVSGGLWGAVLRFPIGIASMVGV